MMEGLRADALSPRVETRSAAALDALRTEVANLKRALASRDVIGQAKGLIMAASGGDAAEAFEVLRAVSQARNQKLADVAAELAARSLPVSDLLATASSVG